MPSPALGDARPAARVAATAALFGVGWGANQFAPLLLVYHRDLGVGEATLEAIFGVYALGLIPGLLIGGPLSDRVGRRAVVLPAAALSVLATGLLMLGGQSIAALFAGRLLAGIVSGAVAQWAPAPTVLPYLPHLLLMVVVLQLLRTAPADARSAGSAGSAGPAG